MNQAVASPADLHDLIEGEVRSRLRERFDVTLPRFDLMAQLDKVPEGMTLSDVSSG